MIAYTLLTIITIATVPILLGLLLQVHEQLFTHDSLMDFPEKLIMSGMIVIFVCVGVGVLGWAWVQQW